jgi:hypothetical protein
MPDRNAIPRRVWLVYEYDPSHGIQGIFGVYSSQEKAEAAATAAIDDGRVSCEIESQDWPVDV